MSRAERKASEASRSSALSSSSEDSSVASKSAVSPASKLRGVQRFRGRRKILQHQDGVEARARRAGSRRRRRRRQPTRLRGCWQRRPSLRALPRLQQLHGQLVAHVLIAAVGGAGFFALPASPPVFPPRACAGRPRASGRARRRVPCARRTPGHAAAPALRRAARERSGNHAHWRRRIRRRPWRRSRPRIPSGISREPRASAASPRDAFPRGPRARRVPSRSGRRPAGRCRDVRNVSLHGQPMGRLRAHGRRAGEQLAQLD